MSARALAATASVPPDVANGIHRPASGETVRRVPVLFIDPYTTDDSIREAVEWLGRLARGEAEPKLFPVSWRLEWHPPVDVNPGELATASVEVRDGSDAERKP